MNSLIIDLIREGFDFEQLEQEAANRDDDFKIALGMLRQYDVNKLWALSNGEPVDLSCSKCGKMFEITDFDALSHVCPECWKTVSDEMFAPSKHKRVVNKKSPDTEVVGWTEVKCKQALKKWMAANKGEFPSRDVWRKYSKDRPDIPSVITVEKKFGGPWTYVRGVMTKDMALVQEVVERWAVGKCPVCGETSTKMKPVFGMPWNRMKHVDVCDGCYRKAVNSKDKKVYGPVRDKIVELVGAL